MDLFDILALGGGLALFLYGMNVMSVGLEKLAGGKLEGILRSMTSSPIKGLLFGALVTAVIQSSTATIVLAVALIGAGVLTLKQAVSIVLGAILAVIFGGANAYLGLRVGMTVSASIPAAVISMGVIRDASCVRDSHRERIQKAYPAYFDTYDEMDKLVNYLSGFENLYCVGRNGQHRYNNMDHSMATAFETVKNIRSGIRDKTNIWNVNTEKAYHEEKQEEKCQN